MHRSIFTECAPVETGTKSSLRRWLNDPAVIGLVLLVVGWPIDRVVMKVVINTVLLADLAFQKQRSKAN